MEIKLCFGDVIFEFVIEREMIVSNELQLYSYSGVKPADIKITFSWDWKPEYVPETKLLGQDALQNYYFDGLEWTCITRAGPKGPIASVKYDSHFKNVAGYINEKPFIAPPVQLSSLIRFIPIRAIFQFFNVLFFHASQISIGNAGILFTAPSGVGKTTQAQLWVKYRQAQLLCNDRTLVRKTNNQWKTYGYPIDGSSPVRTTEIRKLGCVVLLTQAKENQVERLPIAKTVALLMRQMVIDTWNPEAKTKAMNLIMDMMKDIPVYMLSCTPDIRAVECLENQLITDKILTKEELDG